jgi:capsule polysaccharide export protein KpsE/RkpR
VLWLRGRKRDSIGTATLDLLEALSCEIDQLKEKVQALETKAVEQAGRIAMLQSELGLANAEVFALQQLVKEQAARIADLIGENERLRRSMTQVMKKTGTLDWSDP